MKTSRIVLYAAVLLAAATITASAQTTSASPWRMHSFQVRVETNHFGFPSGAAGNWAYIKLPGGWTNQTAQSVFNWLDSNWADVISQTLNTNDWTLLMPTAGTVQATFNWIDDNFSTNNLTAAQLATNNFIRNQAQSTNLGPQSVTRSNLAENAVTASNIVDQTITVSDIGEDAVRANEIGDGTVGRSELDTTTTNRVQAILAYGNLATNPTVTFTSAGTAAQGVNLLGTDGAAKTQQVTLARFLQFHGYIDESSVALSGAGDAIYQANVSVELSANGTSFSNELRATAQILKLGTLIGSDDYMSVPATAAFFVPNGHYYRIHVNAVDNGSAGDLDNDNSWNFIYRLTGTVPTP